MGHNRTFVLLSTIVFASCTLSVAQTVRYFKAEHGVGATYVRLGADGSYRVIDREHMGVFLTDEGYWNQVGDVITFNPKDSKKNSYDATENEHDGKAFLAIKSADAAAGIVIAVEDINKDLDGDPNHLPDHVLFKITAKTYDAETTENYPFHYISMSVITPPEECVGCPRIVVRGRLAPMLSIFDCNGNSGMTCRIKFKRGATLPSRIAVQQLDNKGKLMGKKFLPYPDLKPEEKGWATFPFGSAETIVLLGEWKGPWRSAY